MAKEVLITELIANQIIESVKILGEAMGATSSAGYSLKIENDTFMWRVKMVCADSFYSEAGGYGETFADAWEAFMNYEDTADLNELKRLEAEWDARRRQRYPAE